MDFTYLFQSKLFNNDRPDDMVKEIWPIEELANNYNQYLKDLNKTVRDLNPNTFNNGEGLPILHIFGLRLLGIIKEDPQLPLELLPANWLGTQAAGKFFGIRELILPGAKDFIDNVL